MSLVLLATLWFSQPFWFDFTVKVPMTWKNRLWFYSFVWTPFRSRARECFNFFSITYHSRDIQLESFRSMTSKDGLKYFQNIKSLVSPKCLMRKRFLAAGCWLAFHELTTKNHLNCLAWHWQRDKMEFAYLASIFFPNIWQYWQNWAD